MVLFAVVIFLIHTNLLYNVPINILYIPIYIIPIYLYTYIPIYLRLAVT